MHVERALRAIAGAFIVISVVLAVEVSLWWLVFTAFVGLNLFQSAFTKWCPMVSILKACGMKTCKQQIEAAKGTT